MLLHLTDVAERSVVLGGSHSAEDALECLVVLLPLLNERLGRKLLRALLLGRLCGCLALASRCLLCLGLALAALNRLSHRHRAKEVSLSDIIVNALHVVTKVPLSRKALAFLRALTALISAEEGLVAVAMQAVGLTLMAQAAGSRREACFIACGYLALVRLQVRVDIFARSF